MIRITDSLLLATTKLKSRRTRLAITVVVAGLLFVGMTFISLVFNGMMDSIDRFSSDGLSKRYITKIENAGMPDAIKITSDPGFIAQAKQADKDWIAAKTAEAKKLGIEYDAKSEQLSVKEGNNDQDGKPMASVTAQTAAIFRAKRIEMAKGFYQSIDQTAKSYNVKARYNLTNLTVPGLPMQESSNPTTTINIIKDGKEAQSSKNSVNNSVNNMAKGLANFSRNVSTAESGLLSTFLLPNQTLDVGSDGSVAVIAPFSAAEEALGYAPLPANSSAASRLDRVKQVRANAAGLKFQVCVRNAASTSRQDEAEQQAAAIAQGKTTKDYVMPELVYAKSDKPCEDVKVTRDVRSAEAKKLADKQDAFDAKFGKLAPTQRLVSFRIVGIVPDPPELGGATVKSIVTSLLTSNLGSGWFVPLESAGSLPEYKTTFEDIGKVVDFSSNVLLEFNSPAEAKKFTDEKSCKLDFSSPPTGDVTSYCQKKGTPFMLSSFGSNSLAIDEAKTIFANVFQKAGLVVSAISIIIMMGTIGKVIADSRRETAVFRAIGAKRLDIAQIYLLYAVMLGLIVVVFAFGVGWLLATWAQSKLAADMTIESLIVFNATNLDRKFSLIGVNFRQLLTLVGLILAGACLSSVVPLLSNLKRNPIRDMRDER